mgnify:CR=1 FL=1
MHPLLLPFLPLQSLYFLPVHLSTIMIQNEKFYNLKLMSDPVLLFFELCICTRFSCKRKISVLHFSPIFHKCQRCKITRVFNNSICIDSFLLAMSSLKILPCISFPTFPNKMMCDTQSGLQRLEDLPEHRLDSVRTIFSHPDYVLLP